MSSLVSNKIAQIEQQTLSPLDLLPQTDMREKLVDLMLRGVPPGIHSIAKRSLSELRQTLVSASVEEVKVVVFGGGTGLSNIIGGDSRLKHWPDRAFGGLKAIFPYTKSVVCITDDGGSTGELLKDIPLLAIGDMRHVLLSSVQLSLLQKKYSVDSKGAEGIAKSLAFIFNWRFSGPLEKNSSGYLTIKSALNTLPQLLSHYLSSLCDDLFSDPRLVETLQRAHCFGNLLLVAAIYRELDNDLTNKELAEQPEAMHEPVYEGINLLGRIIGAGDRAVRPCTSTAAQLKVLYTNGVAVTGEHKLEEAKRGVPVDSITIEYCGCDKIEVSSELLQDISEADIIILAPGSLYSSIIPIFKVPGLANAVRGNQNALKVLISNLWVQAGETDLSIVDPTRKFHVSDMIRAYEKNIPGGTTGLFREVLCVSLKEIPASILQNYAVEGKVPIYLDKDVLHEQQYAPIECGVYSEDALVNRNVIQHDPDTLALAIKGLFSAKRCFAKQYKTETAHSNLQKNGLDSPVPDGFAINVLYPCQRFSGITDYLNTIKIRYIGDGNLSNISRLTERIIDIFWQHPTIPLDHLHYFEGIHFYEKRLWNRDQQWDNVFSFYDPVDRCIKIRGDQIEKTTNLETALLIALGESLLGDYAKQKIMKEVDVDNRYLGRAYYLHLREKDRRCCYLSQKQLHTFLLLSRMCETESENLYTRLVNNGEGFTPPGLLMGLMYAWYVDNRLATHIEYKMSVMKIDQNDLIPEQLKMVNRRRKMIKFFKEIVFNS